MDLRERVAYLETQMSEMQRELSSIKRELGEEAAGSACVRGVVEQRVVREVNRAVEPREVREVRRASVRRKDMEFQVGKTIMSLLASLLVLCSIVLFGSMVYPYLSDDSKCLVMYLVSGLFVAGGLWGRKTSFKTFFTAIAGCGASALYLSGIISHLVFGIFGISVLFVLTLAWTVGIAWLSKHRIPVFVYICYLGVITSTVLCSYMYPSSLAGLICYLVGMIVLYSFNKSSSHKQDMFYWVQLPIIMFFMLFTYDNVTLLQQCPMSVAVACFVIQHYLYREKAGYYRVVMLMTEAVILVGYSLCLGLIGILNIMTLFLCAVVAFWSYFIFEDELWRMCPLWIMSVFVPLMNWGSFCENYFGYLPFCIVILLLGFYLESYPMKGIATGFFLAYVFDMPVGLSAEVFYLLIVAYAGLCGILFYMKHKQLDLPCLMITVGSVLTVLCASEYQFLLIIGYAIAVLFSYIFNSPGMICSDLTQRSGWAWSGYWIVFGSGTILFELELGFTLIVMFLYVLLAYLVNAKWQLNCKNWFACAELCLKFSFFVWMVLHKLVVSGVVISIVFLLLSVCCVLIGAKFRQRVARVYGLVLSIISVIKCLLFDIQYSSSIYRPVGLLVAGLLCFGISYVYSVLERKLVEHSDE